MYLISVKLRPSHTAHVLIWDKQDSLFTTIPVYQLQSLYGTFSRYFSQRLYPQLCKVPAEQKAVFTIMNVSIRLCKRLNVCTRFPAILSQSYNARNPYFPYPGVNPAFLCDIYRYRSIFYKTHHSLRKLSNSFKNRRSSQ